MKITCHPFHASIAPQEQLAASDSLWHCVIRRDGSAEILARHDTCRKEDAACVALLELARLQRLQEPQRDRRQAS